MRKMTHSVLDSVLAKHREAHSWRGTGDSHWFTTQDSEAGLWMGVDITVRDIKASMCSGA